MLRVMSWKLQIPQSARKGGIVGNHNITTSSGRKPGDFLFSRTRPIRTWHIVRLGWLFTFLFSATLLFSGCYQEAPKVQPVTSSNVVFQTTGVTVYRFTDQGNVVYVTVGAYPYNASVAVSRSQF